MCYKVDIKGQLADEYLPHGCFVEPHVVGQEVGLAPAAPVIEQVNPGVEQPRIAQEVAVCGGKCQQEVALLRLSHQ